jgi:superfamily I DNA/RNA helicase
VEFYLKEFEKLNEYQKNAVTSEEKYVLLNAAVGSGKTTVLVHKVLYLHLIKKIPLSDMVVLTFTRRAAEEIKSRIQEFIKELSEPMQFLGTFHSVASQILRDSQSIAETGYHNDFEIIDNVQAAELLYEIIEQKKLNIKYKKKLMKRVEEFKEGKYLYGVMKKNDDIEELVCNYKKEKLSKNVMDFDDIIEYCNIILKEPINPKWVIIDEFQDTDYRQLELVKKICGTETNIFCIGDPNQIIYSWRSGTENIFNEYKIAYKPAELSLPINYRSTKTIIEAANSFLYGTFALEGTKDYGDPIKIVRHYDAFNEALHIANIINTSYLEGTPYKNAAILYRRQAQLEVVLDVFEKENIPCNVVYKNNLAFEDDERTNLDENGVNLLTLHASKGLEFSNVFIIGANMGNIPLTSSKANEPEEMRLFYVGITRAKNNLEISYLINPSISGVVAYKSPYISMIPQKLLLVQDDETKIKNTLSDLMVLLKEERHKENHKKRMAGHSKYGIGTIVYEDEEIMRVEFDAYGEKEFSKMFCCLEIIED